MAQPPKKVKHRVVNIKPRTKLENSAQFQNQIGKKKKKVVPGTNMRRILVREEKRHFIIHTVGTSISANSYMSCNKQLSYNI